MIEIVTDINTDRSHNCIVILVVGIFWVVLSFVCYSVSRAWYLVSCNWYTSVWYSLSCNWYSSVRCVLTFKGNWYSSVRYLVHMIWLSVVFLCGLTIITGCVMRKSLSLLFRRKKDFIQFWVHPIYFFGQVCPSRAH